MNQGYGKTGRRSALGWILGGTALLIAAGGAGIYAYSRYAQPGAATAGTQAPNPAIHILKGHSAAVTSVSLSSNGTQLATGSLDQSARIWSTADGTTVATMQAGSAVEAVAWNPDGSKLATGTENHSVVLWSASGALIKRETGWGAAVSSLAWRKDSNLLFLGTNGNGLHALQISNYKRYGHNTPQVLVNAIATSPDGKLLALALNSGRVYFADLGNNWADVAAIAPEHGAALSVAWSPDNNMLVVGYADGNAIVYDAASRKVQFLLKHKGPVNSVAWSPNSTAAVPLLVSGAGDSTVNIWNLQGKGTQIAYSGHTDAVLGVAWGATMLASASKDQTAILWQPPTF